MPYESHHFAVVNKMRVDGKMVRFLSNVEIINTSRTIRGLCSKLNMLGEKLHIYSIRQNDCFNTIVTLVWLYTLYERLLVLYIHVVNVRGIIIIRNITRPTRYI